MTAEEEVHGESLTDEDRVRLAVPATRGRSARMLGPLERGKCEHGAFYVYRWTWSRWEGPESGEPEMVESADCPRCYPTERLEAVDAAQSTPLPSRGMSPHGGARKGAGRKPLRGDVGDGESPRVTFRASVAAERGAARYAREHSTDEEPVTAGQAPRELLEAYDEDEGVRRAVAAWRARRDA